MLLAWLSQRLTREDVVFRAPEVILRFAFMDGNVPRTVALRYLQDFECALASYVAELRVQEEQMRAQGKVHTGLLAFQSGIEGMEAQLHWARRARTLLVGNSTKSGNAERMETNA